MDDYALSLNAPQSKHTSWASVGARDSPLNPTGFRLDRAKSDLHPCVNNQGSLTTTPVSSESYVPPAVLPPQDPSYSTETNSTAAWPSAIRTNSGPLQEVSPDSAFSGSSGPNPSHSLGYPHLSTSSSRSPFQQLYRSLREPDIQLEDVASYSTISSFVSLNLQYLHSLSPLVHKPSYSQSLMMRRDKTDRALRAFILGQGERVSPACLLTCSLKANTTC